jgi:RNA polymerase sigma factor (sigma-70 family)
MNPMRDVELEAFGRLIELHHAAVSAVAFAITRDTALTDDVTQDTFVAAWAQRGSLRDPSRVRPWLCGIARNQARNALRRRRREVPIDDVTQVDPQGAFDAAAEREMQAKVRAALEKLPDAYREPLVLYYWQERSISEVASVLAISEQAAQKRLSRARSYFAEGLGNQLEQIGRRRRSATAVATAVVAILVAQAGTAHAAIQPAVSRSLRGLGRPLLAAVVAGGVGAALVAVLAREPERCCDAAAGPAVRSEPPPTASTQRERELTNALIRVEFENKARDQRLQDLEKLVLTPAAARPSRARKAPVATAAVESPSVKTGASSRARRTRG